MGVIRQLDDNLSNLIAAGEVVVNMASVVKELVENAIDAHATEVTVNLLESGLNEIKVTDNGIGMSLEDMKMCIKRHATSKIKTSHDLFHIQSLGFRGEAIPSIASVSHLEIISGQGENAHKLLYVNGKLKEEVEYAPKKGTIMTVRYLFYNTPARLKHLKATTTELSYIVDYINKIALSHPEINFVLTNNNKKLFQSSGSNEILKVLSNIYHLDIIKNMVPFNNENAYFKIEGYLTKPTIYRSNRNHITVIANNRMIKNNQIIHAVTESYKTYLPIGKYPIVVLNITLDPLLIDVNVHPQKLEVKFTEESLLRRLITETLRETIKSLELIPVMKEKKTEESNIIQPSLDLTKQPAPVKQNTTYTYQEPKQEPKQEQVIIETPKLVKEEPVFEGINQTIKEEKTVITPKTNRIPRLEYIGQYMGTYLIAQNEEGLYIIDQHAAAERIRYENYLDLFGNVEIQKTTLLIPLKLNLSNSEVLQLKEQINITKSLGLDLEISDEFGVNILSVPHWFPKGYELIYTEEIIKYIQDGKQVSVKMMRDDLAKNLSCKHSIKANKYININEINKLLEDLSMAHNPYTCPHGRPVIIKWTQTDIEKMFKRII